MLPSRSTLVHLRLPFSFYLAPIFLLALALSERADPARSLAAFFIIHILLYTASNAFNSYYDRDQGSIGGIENPPPVTPDLLPTALVLDAAAVASGFLISAWFAAYLFLYGLGSKAYSWDRTRLKRFPIASWLAVGFGQGAVTFAASYGAINGLELAALLDGRVLVPAGLIMLVLLGVYPLTQIYQHAEDRRQGVTTFSMLAGVTGTFAASAACFGAGIGGLALLLAQRRSLLAAGIFLAGMLPALAYFAAWFLKARKNPAAADFKHTMRMNLISSAGLNFNFLLLFLLF